MPEFGEAGYIAGSVEPELKNHSVLEQIRWAIVMKLRLFWPLRSQNIGFVLILVDHATGECRTTTAGEEEILIEATERVASGFRQNKGRQARLAG